MKDMRDSRIAQLESQLADHEARVAALEARYEPPPPRPEVDGVFVMPTTQQARQLIAIAARVYPARFDKMRGIDDAALRRFAMAFGVVADFHRTPGVIDHRHGLDYWLTEAALHLREHHGLNQSISGEDFLLSVVTHGDIDYTPLDDHPGFALMIGSRAGSRAATNQWMKVIETGRLRPPIAKQDRPPAPRVHNILITGGDRGRTVGSEWG
jgi:hypothetical protein